MGVKQHHHIKVDRDVKEDLKLWKGFLTTTYGVCRPFMDFSDKLLAKEIDLYSDASSNYGWGCTYKNFWCYSAWTRADKERYDNGLSNIQIMELLAFTVAVELFAPLLRNKRVVTYCDNQAVVAMINNSSSSCRVCMELIRIVTLTSMKYNCRFFSEWIPTKQNGISDSLSRLDFDRFRKLAPHMSEKPLDPPVSVWPMRNEWWNH